MVQLLNEEDEAWYLQVGPSLRHDATHSPRQDLPLMLKVRPLHPDGTVGNTLLSPAGTDRTFKYWPSQARADSQHAAGSNYQPDSENSALIATIGPTQRNLRSKIEKHTWAAGTS